MDNIFDLEELEKILRDGIKKASTLVPDKISETNLETKFLTTTKINLVDAILDGPSSKSTLARKNIKETDKLKKGTKNYILKHYSKDGKLRKISFSEPNNPLEYFVKYYKNKRFIFPKTPEGHYCPKEAYITIYDDNGNVTREYYLADKSQILAFNYTYNSDRTVICDFINYIPNATTYPVHSLHRSKLFLDDLTKYEFIDEYVWLDEYKKTWTK